MRCRASVRPEPRKLKSLEFVNLLITRNEPCPQKGKTIRQDDSDAYDLWCAYDQYDDDGTLINVWQTDTSVIQTYYDQFYVSGLSVREDHGLEVAMIAQPNSLNGYDGYLWDVADKLQSGWLAGQTHNGSRFDVFDLDEAYTSYVDDGSLYIREISLSNQVGLGDIASTYNEEVLSDLFESPSEGQAVTLLYATEDSYRSEELASNATTINNNQVSLDLSETQLETYGYLRWAPFIYQDGAWQTYDELQTYIDEELGVALATVLSDDMLNQIVDGDAISDSHLAQEGAIRLAQNYYLAVYAGASNLLELDGRGLSDETLSDETLTLSDDSLVVILQALLADMQAFYDRIALNVKRGDDLTVTTIAWQRLAASASSLLVAIGEAVEGLDNTYTLALQELTTYYQTANFDTSDFNTSALSGIGKSVKLALNGNASWATVVQKSMNLLNRVRILYRAVNRLKDTLQLASLSYINYQFRQMPFKYFRWSLLVNLIIVVVVNTLMTVLYIVTNGISVNSLAFTQALAYLYAQIVVEVIMLFLSLNPVSAIVVAVIALVDALIAAICAIVRASGENINNAVNTWVCGGITGALTNALMYVFYDQTPLVNFDKKKRLDFSIERMTLKDEKRGFTVGNQMTIGGVLTSSLYFDTPTSIGWTYWYQFSDKYLKSSGFDYAFQASEDNLSVSRGDTDWDIPSNRDRVGDGEIPRDKRFFKAFERSNEFTLTESGINQPIKIYLTESYSIRTQECVNPVGLAPVCYLRSKGKSLHSDLSEHFLFDVFPATLTGFVEMQVVRENSYRMAWDEQFPVLFDADGDGLVSQAKGGPDPNDNNPDFDADGLSDFWEYSNGYDMSQADGDGDGLSDYWEALHETNPHRADSDHDGLIDGDEMFHPNKHYPYENDIRYDDNPNWSGGWTIVYDYDEAGAPLNTRISANPLDTDSDDDQILDNFEYIYGYNPTVPNNLNVLSLKSGLTGPNVVPPGATIGYTAVITNQLDNRYARGLLQAEFPVDVVQTTEVIDTIPPGGTASMDGSVTAPNISASQVTSLTVRSGAIIDDLLTDRILWLRLNENESSSTFADDSQLGNDAICWSENLCPTANGSHLEFDGEDDYLVIENHEGFELDAYSVGMWVVPTPIEINTTENLIERPKDFKLGFQYSSQGPSNVVQPIVTSELCGPSAAAGGQTVRVIRSWYSETNLTLGSWNHVMFTSDHPSRTTLYVNGLATDTSVELEIIPVDECPTSTNNITLGKQGNRRFRGLMDEVEFYQRVLSADEVKDLVQAPILQVDMESLRDNSNSQASVGCSLACPSTNAEGAAFNQTEGLWLNDSALALQDGEFTFATWLKPKERNHSFDSALADILTFKDTSYDWQSLFGHEWGLDSDNDKIYETLEVGYPTLAISDEGHVRIRFGHANDISQHCQFQSSSPLLTFDSWQHLVVSFDSSQDRYLLYLNGDLVDSGATNCNGASPSTDYSAFYLGQPKPETYLYLDRLRVIDMSGNSEEFRVKYDNNRVWGHDFSGNNTKNGPKTALTP